MSMPMALTLPLAHLLPTGLGPWGDGMARLFLEPTELLLVALEVRLRPVVLLSLAAVLSGLFALVAGSALAGHPGALAALLAETVAMAVVSTLLCQSLAPPHPRWRVIGLRVGGSWITAAALLMLGWLVRHPQ
jgi:hypothetical protein